MDGIDETFGARFWRVGPRGTVLLTAMTALLLAACGGGGETPESLARALSDASSSFDYLAPDEQDCVGHAILDNIGFDSLVAEEITTESLADDPAQVVLLVETGDDDLSDAVQACVDADRLFRDGLTEEVLTAPLDCETPFSSTDDLVGDYVAGLVGGDDPTITVEDTDVNRDRFRPCVSDVDFATMFDLDQADDLAVALSESLPEELVPDVDDGQCFGPQVVDEIGVERLNEAGVRVDSADLVFNVSTLLADERDVVVDAAQMCSELGEFHRASFLQSDPAYADCLEDSLGDAYEDAIIRDAFGQVGQQRLADRLRLDALDACVEKRSIELFGNIEEVDALRARTLARGLRLGLEPLGIGVDDYLAPPSIYRCAAHGMVADIGADRTLDLFDTIVYSEEPTPEVVEAIEELLGPGGVFTKLRVCSGDDFVFTATTMFRAGFTETTLECVEGRVADELEVAATLPARVYAPVDSDEYFRTIDDLDTFSQLLVDSLERCSSPAEEDRLDDYLDFVDDVENHVYDEDGDEHLV